MSDDEYFDFCKANPDVFFERTAEGEIIIVPPAGFESDNQNADVVRQLGNWAIRDGRGMISGPTVEFILPLLARRGMDLPRAAVTPHERTASEISSRVPGIRR